jgi:hypothetical protein
LHRYDIVLHVHIVTLRRGKTSPAF